MSKDIAWPLPLDFSGSSLASILFALTIIALLARMSLSLSTQPLQMVTGIARRTKFPPARGVHPKPSDDQTVPAGLDYLNGFVEIRQQSIWWQCFRPKLRTRKAVGVVVIYHGYADHSDYRIFEDARDLAIQSNLIIIAFDQPGFGRSDGVWAYIPDWFKHVEACVEATKTITTLVLTDEERNLPLIGYGTSMGGGVAICASILNPGLFSGLVLTAPMCGISPNLRPNFLVENILLIASRLFPTLPITPIPDLGELCYEDPKYYIFERSRNHLCYPSRPRLGTARSMLEAQNWITANSSKLMTPFLLLHGDSDAITSTDLSLAFFSNASSSEKEIEILPRYYHILFGAGVEPEKSSYVMKRIIRWIDSRCEVAAIRP